MSLTDAYLVTTKNLEAVFNAIQSAQAPEKFSQKFLEQLDLTSSNDRLYIKILKELGFLDDAGIPLDRYYKFLDTSESRRILAEAIKEAYSDLFSIKKEAWKLTMDEVENKFKTLTQGKKSVNVIHLMANTFKALCEYADWSQNAASDSVVPKKNIEDRKSEVDNGPLGSLLDRIRPTEIQPPDKLNIKGGLHYNIQIHLPESRDPKVYDAIFESLKRHLI